MAAASVGGGSFRDGAGRDPDTGARRSAGSRSAGAAALLAGGDGDPDAALAARARAGDADAFAALHARWAARVRRFAATRLGSREDAEDVAQEVFLALHLGLARYEGRARFGTWLLGIAHHVTCRRLRRRARDACAPLDAVAHRAAAPAAPADARLDAARVLARCEAVLAADASPAQRAILVLCAADGCSAADAAARLGRRPDAVRAHLVRARKKLREGVPEAAELLGA